MPRGFIIICRKSDSQKWLQGDRNPMCAGADS
jgi:hypothetical protein